MQRFVYIGGLVLLLLQKYCGLGSSGTSSVGVFGDTVPLGVEALVWVGGIVDNLQLAVLVEEAVPALQVPLPVPFLVTELPVVPAPDRRAKAGQTLSGIRP